MTTKRKIEKPSQFKCDQPGCNYIARFARTLGAHKRLRHGILGSAGSSVRKRQKQERAAAISPQLAGGLRNHPSIHDPHQCPHCSFIAKWSGGLKKHMNAMHPGVTTPPTPTKKEKALVKRTAQTIVLANGHDHPQGQDHSNADGITDALVALAAGRFIELCSNVAFEFDIPARKFTARVAAFIHSAQVR